MAARFIQASSKGSGVIAVAVALGYGLYKSIYTGRRLYYEATILNMNLSYPSSGRRIQSSDVQ